MKNLSLCSKALAGALLLLACAYPPSVSAQPDASPGKLLRLRGGAVDPADSLAHASRDRLRQTPVGEDVVGIVQLRGRASPEAAAQLRARGLEVLAYQPDDAYIVRGTPEALEAAAGNRSVRWSGELLPEHRIAPGVRAKADAGAPSELLELALWPGEDSARTIERLEVLGATGIVPRQAREQGARILFELAPSFAAQLAELAEVAWIEPAPQLTRRVNLSRAVVQSGTGTLVPLWDNGLLGEGQIVGHIDGDIDMAMCYFRDDETTGNTPGPDHRKVVAFYGGLHPGDDFGTRHGTASAAVIAAFATTPTMTFDNAGVAPMARLVHSYDLDISGSGNNASTLKAEFLKHRDDGARIHSNSWGDDSTTVYTFWCQDIDSFMYENEDHLVVFAVTNTSTLKSPENAKNVLAVGASRQFPLVDSHFSGGIGPTNDGRRKPETYAPGEGILMARRNTFCDVLAQSGTSFAAPAVAGAAALAREYYMRGYYPTGTPTPGDEFTPTGALLKATLLNASRDMTGVAGYPSNREGWGLLEADRALHFAGEDRKLLLFDVRHNEGFSAAPDTRQHLVEVTSGTEELRITLVWSDPPAANGANPALINNLNLVALSPFSEEYLGNVFSGGVSTTGGSADGVNTVEQILIPNPEAGVWQVTVEAASLPMGPQGYAVVASGAVTAPPPTRVEHWWIIE